jgi:hypothetical protein
VHELDHLFAAAVWTRLSIALQFLRDLALIELLAGGALE